MDIPWVVEFGYASLSLGLAIVFDDAGDFVLDILESIERDVGNFVLNTILLEPEAATSKQDVG